MERKNILAQVQEIFCDVLDNEDIILKDETSANDIDEWDSLSHIQLIVALEKHFKIKFTSKEILSWKNVGEMIDNIKSKLP
jgi:acyl carrier protein